MPDLTDQLAKVFQTAFDADPGLRDQLALALGSGDGERVTKAEANYRPSDNTDEQCGNCVHLNGDTCEIVSGKINRNYVSDYFEPRPTQGAPVEGADVAADQ